MVTRSHAPPQPERSAQTPGLLADTGYTVEGDSARLRGAYRFFVVAHRIYLFSAVGHFLFIGLFTALGVPPLAIYNVASVLLFLLCIHLNRTERFCTAFALAGIEVFVHSTLCALLIGWATGYHYFIVGIIPFAMLLPDTSTPIKTAISAVILAAYGTVYFLTMNVAPPYALGTTVQAVLNFINLGIAFGAFSLLVYYLHSASIHAESEVQSLSRTDQLTGLLNRRGMETHLDAARSALDRNGESFSILLGDLDHFKRINDDYGHGCGDKVLVAAAEALSSALRSRDVVSRWGGEEFLVLLPGTESEGAASVAHKLLESVQEMRVSCGTAEVSVTITLGGATARHGSECDRLVTAADRALYDGKNAGRNCFIAENRED